MSQIGVARPTSSDVGVRGRPNLWLTRGEAQAQTSPDFPAARDLDQALLTISNLILSQLDSDIAGVFLLDGETLVMRCCVGNHMAETARLRMRAGQGLAGRVLATSAPCTVQAYGDDDHISPHFNNLAERECARAALGVPMLVGGEPVGVLEVWRRDDRSFDEADVEKLTGLATLATIAIDNARLHDAQARSVAQLAAARADLQSQVDRLHRSATLQQDLLSVLVLGEGLPAVARTVHQAVGCGVAILSSHGDLLALEPTSVDGHAIRDAVGPRAARGPTTFRAVVDGRELWAQQVMAGNDRLGVVCVLGEEGAEDQMKVVAGQLALACALHHLEQRAAHRARAAARDEVLWDLVRGPRSHRVAAISRAERLHVDLHGPRLIIVGHLNLGAVAESEGWDTKTNNSARSLVRRVAGAVTERHRGHMAGVEGDRLVVLASAEVEVGPLISELRNDLQALPSVRTWWGTSTPHNDPLALDEAFDEAEVSATVAQRLGVERTLRFDELGVVRLLVGGTGGEQMTTFVEDVIGPILAYDRSKNGELLQTLRAYFDADCSQKVAADMLYVHHKTLSYRLKQIRELTGLDLHGHADRMRADLALRIHLVAERSSNPR